MHFGQTLEASTLPEWKSRYVDFKQGKKLIAKLDKQLGGQPVGDWALPPPAMHMHGPPPTSAATSSRPESSDQSAVKAGPEPVPYRPPTAATYATGNAPPGPRPQPVNDRSPLLETPGTRLYQTPDPAAEPPHSNLLLAIGANPPSLSQEEARANARREFFAWISAQTTKAADFYSLMLEEAETKLDVLLVQFAHFDVHRQEHRQEKMRLNAQQQATTSFLSNLDLPSVPAVFKTGVLAALRHPHRRRIARAAAHTSDFNNKDDHVGYYQAKAMLRSSVMGFYQFLSQLREFRQLNYTAVRKIIKKFDKQLHFRTLDKYMDETRDISLRSSDQLDSIIIRVEELFAREFTKGNHKLAMEMLRARFLQEDQPHNTPVMFSGIMLGAALPLIVLGLYSALHHQHRLPAETNYLLQMYGGFALIGLMLVGFGGCLQAWAHYRINYAFVLDLDRTTMLDHREYLVLPAIYVFGLGLFGWLTFDTVQEFHRYYPCVYLGIAVAVLALPTKRHLQGHSRWWLLHTLWRLVLSGLYPVEFRDLMIGDIMCSLTYSVSTLELFFCIYSTHNWWGDGAGRATRCTSRHSRALGFLNCLPGIWRFLQCWRRYADTLDWFPHMLNAGKYSFNILYNMSLSLARISPRHPGLKAMFIVFALINGLYSGIWDVLMDFSLVPSSKPREVLVFPKWSYWAVMVLDLVMRQNWVLYVVFWNHKTQGAMISFIVALIEASRRIMWLAIRVENEHAANIARCRAFKELSLPYDDIRPKTITARTSQRNQYNESVRRATTFNAPSSQPPSAESRHASQTGTPTVLDNIKRATSLPRWGSTSPAMSTPDRPQKSPPFAPFVLSPRLQFAHTNDFQRRRPDVRNEDEDEDDEEDGD